jgi:hypothetical protein
MESSLTALMAQRTDYARMADMCRQTSDSLAKARLEPSEDGCVSFSGVTYMSKAVFDEQDPLLALQQLTTGPVVIKGVPSKRLRSVHKIMAHLGIDISRKVEIKGEPFQRKRVFYSLFCDPYFQIRL